MDTQVNELSINGVTYVPKSTVFEKAANLDGMRYVIVRTYTAGVFAGYLEKKQGKEVVLRHVRRLWYWAGAASLSQLATYGTNKPKECKFPAIVDRIEVTEAIEIIDVTDKAKNSIDGVAVWEA
jgi:hypothetical protein